MLWQKISRKTWKKFDQPDLLAFHLKKRFAKDCYTWRKFSKNSPSAHASMEKDVKEDDDDNDDDDDDDLN